MKIFAAVRLRLEIAVAARLVLDLLRRVDAGMGAPGIHGAARADWGRRRRGI
jgi:hypothetical protein